MGSKTFHVQRIPEEHGWAVIDPFGEPIALCAEEGDAHAIVDALYIVHKMVAVCPQLLDDSNDEDDEDDQIRSYADVVGELANEYQCCQALRLNHIAKYKTAFED